jgi:amino acid adenylation domain-containing protein
VLQQQLTYWSGQLAGAPTLLALPTDRPRPATPSRRGASLALTIPATATAALNQLAKANQATLFMTLSAAFSVLLARYSGQNDICLGTPIANRNRAEVEPLIGYFANTLVLRSRIDERDSFEALLAQVRNTTLDAYAHQDLPFEQVVDAVKPERNLAHTPLFQVMLVLQNAPLSELSLPDLALRIDLTQDPGAKFDLTLNLREKDGEIHGAFEYRQDLFDQATIKRFHDHYLALLNTVCRDSTAPLGTLQIISNVERAQILLDWNNTASPYPSQATVHELFEQQALTHPTATAVVFENQSLSYGELNIRANRLAHCLRERGVGPDVPVAICTERSLDMLVGLLAILKAGGAYVPLDPAYPADRLTYMLEDVAPALLLTQQHLQASLPKFAIDTLYLDQAHEFTAAASPANPPALAKPQNLAYILYTSGSTGKPKGVLVSHDGLCNLVHEKKDAFGAGPQQRMLQFASLNFDASTWEIFTALANGATLCMAGRHALLPGDALRDTIQALGITIALLPPVALNAMPAEGLDHLQTLLSGGEACSEQLSRQWSPGRALFNAYGPTEGTVYATQQRCHPDYPGAPAIGRPIPNVQLYILDAGLSPLPVGVAGELHIAGVGLARGYHGRPGLTAERFVPNPYAAPGARMYRSGDLARYRPDGSIDYLGRLDDQVKIRGFRIELGEIEAALATLPGVRQAAVLVREDVPGDKRLVAYYVHDQNAAMPDAPALRVALALTLPDFMLPAHFVQLDQLPLTLNGKLDRKALPLPDQIRGENGYIAPRNDVEAMLADIWAGLLGIDRVGVHDNFFDLGGHSLLATTLASEIRVAFEIAVPLRALFEHPTIASEAALIEALIMQEIDKMSDEEAIAMTAATKSI